MERPHHGLMAWQEAMEVARAVYSLTGEFPVAERFGLTAVRSRNWIPSSGLRETLVSVIRLPPSNGSNACSAGWRH